MNFQRDGFISTAHRLAAADEDIVFLSADFGAPSLDDFRAKLPRQFFHLGISEQNLIDVAIGLSLQGKKVITYAMAPFISMRCAEQHKLAAMMDCKIINIFAGVGLGYANAGPTHYATEDFGLATNMIGSSVFTMADTPTAVACAEHLLTNPTFSFVRMDREPGPDLAPVSVDEFKKGYRSFFSGYDLCVVSHGHSLARIVTFLNDLPEISNRITVIDLFRSKPIGGEFFDQLNQFKNILILDEQIPSSSLGQFVLPQLSKDLKLGRVRSMALSEKFMFANTGREGLLAEAGLSTSKIVEEIESLLKE